ncbi:hypothetical protein TEA_019166 [Camellia sinensis var. sinensis]|uniref:Uncharacterized protein n=1 Tax=Camellia sinensis var. sinensis TaxID=542762 RepID=A0A4S4EIM1_CAMSN|nr:hypothetical protein TEA_019166 [Camellia sinensis var. sinensis]
MIFYEAVAHLRFIVLASSSGVIKGLLTLCGMHDSEAKPVLLCSCNDNSVRVYDLPSFSERGKIFAKQEVRSIQIGPGGLFFTGDGTGQVKVWNWLAEPTAAGRARKWKKRGEREGRGGEREKERGECSSLWVVADRRSRLSPRPVPVVCPAPPTSQHHCHLPSLPSSSNRFLWLPPLPPPPRPPLPPPPPFSSSPFFFFVL